MSISSTKRAWIVVAVLIGLAAAGAGAAAHESSPAIHITTLSSRPYLISGGDVLVLWLRPGTIPSRGFNLLLVNVHWVECE